MNKLLRIKPIVSRHKSDNAKRNEGYFSWWIWELVIEYSNDVTASRFQASAITIWCIRN